MFDKPLAPFPSKIQERHNPHDQSPKTWDLQASDMLFLVRGKIKTYWLRPPDPLSKNYTECFHMYHLRNKTYYSFNKIQVNTGIDWLL